MLVTSDDIILERTQSHKPQTLSLLDIKYVGTEWCLAEDEGKGNRKLLCTGSCRISGFLKAPEIGWAIMYVLLMLVNWTQKTVDIVYLTLL